MGLNGYYVHLGQDLAASVSAPTEMLDEVSEGTTP